MKKRLITIFVLLVLIVGCFNITVFANETPEYDILSAEFHIQIKEDGNVNVQELWTIQYYNDTKLPFNRYIFKDVPRVEQMNYTLCEIIVDGNNCYRINGHEKKENYRYVIQQESDNLQYNVYFEKTLKPQQVVISYELTDAVKLIGDEYYLFQYRLLPQTFKQNIPSLYISLTFPHGCKFDNVLYNAASGDIFYGESQELCETNISGLTTLKITMENGFNQLPQSSHISTDEYTAYDVFMDMLSEAEGLESADKFMIFGSIGFMIISSIVPIMITTLVFVLLIFMFKKQSAARKTLENNPNLLNEIFNKWRARGYSPAQIMAGFSKNSYLNLLVCLADLINAGVIIWDENQNTILFPITPMCTGYKLEILKILEECRDKELPSHLPYPTENNYYKLPISALIKYMKNQPSTSFDNRNYQNCMQIERHLFNISPNADFSIISIQNTAINMSSKVNEIKEKLNSETYRELSKEYVNDLNTFGFCMPKAVKNMPTVSWNDLVNSYTFNPLLVMYYCGNHYRNVEDMPDDLTKFATKRFQEIDDNRKRTNYTTH